jgi:hypothetical protein
MPSYSRDVNCRTLRQQETELAAAGYGISVDEYLRAMDLHPSTEFVARPAWDPIEADHMQAILIANARSRARETASPLDFVRKLNMDAYERANKL